MFSMSGRLTTGIDITCVDIRFDVRKHAGKPIVMREKLVGFDSAVMTSKGGVVMFLEQFEANCVILGNVDKVIMEQ